MSGCNCDQPKVVAAIDKNLDDPFSSGNKFCRYCLTCGRRKFCSKEWFSRQTDRFAILPGSKDELSNWFECPSCDSGITGEPDSCPNCDAPFQWDD